MDSGAQSSRGAASHIVIQNTFDELLDKLRLVHLEVCARSGLIETQNSASLSGVDPTHGLQSDLKDDPQNGPNLQLKPGTCKDELTERKKLASQNKFEDRPHNGPHVLLESHSWEEPVFQNELQDDPWLPWQFRAPLDGPPPRRFPPRAGAPIIFDFPVTDTLEGYQDMLARQHEDLLRSIENLSRQQDGLSKHIKEQQDHLSRQIAEIINTSKETLSVASARRKGGSRSIHANRCTKAEGANRCTKGRFTTAVPSGDHDGIAPAGDVGDSMASVGSAQSQRFAVETKPKRQQTEMYMSQPKRIPLWVPKTFGELRECVHLMLEGAVFGALSAAVILSFLILIAVETHMMSQDPDGRFKTIQAFHYVYIFYWCFEASLRFLADGWHAYTGRDGVWNRLDLLFIASGFIEIILENAGNLATMASVVKNVRIWRAFRTVRLIRAAHHVHEFQKMAYALLTCFKTLVCSWAILCFVMFFFAVWFTQSAADVDMREKIQDLELRYGDLLATTYTLFLSVSNGISWDACYVPLHRLSWLSGVGFIVYIFCVLFGLVNVVTSVFVESVIRSVQHYKDLIVQDKEKDKKIAIQHIRSVFHSMDSDGSGVITFDEMEYFLADLNLRSYMEALEIESEDIGLLFNLVDLDGSGHVDVDEFCEGCLKLKGSARSMDIHILCYQVRQFLSKWGDFTFYVEDSFAHLRTKIK